MIPILYETNETAFTSNGIGGLSDAVSCRVNEQRNGEYTMTMEYPVDGAHYEDITMGSPIKVFCGSTRSWQVFRVWSMSRPLRGIVTIECQHLSYQLSLIPVSPFSASSAGAAMSGLKTNAAVACPFTLTTDKATVASFKVTEPSSIRSRLGGTQGSILDAFGGEFEFDNYNVRLWAARGVNRGVTIRYGKNLTDIVQEQNIGSTITGLFPYYAADDGYVELPEKVIEAANASAFPYPRTVPMNFTDDFESAPTVAQLRAKAQAYLAGSGIGIPKVNITLSFIALADTDEYAGLSRERVELCDTVTVIYERLGVEATAKVIATTWDALAERYESIEVGDARTTLADTIATTQQEAEQTAAEAVDRSALTAAIENATNLITGVSGGYIKYHYDADGHPTEMLIMDSADEATATHIWRYNSAGWGHSSDGGQTYTTAATLDGGIVADFITAGTLTGLNINNGNGTFTVDSAGNMVTSSATITNGSINNGSGTFRVDSSGNVTANSLTSNNATITGGSIALGAPDLTTAKVRVRASTGYMDFSAGRIYGRYLGQVTYQGTTRAATFEATLTGGALSQTVYLGDYTDPTTTPTNQIRTAYFSPLLLVMSTENGDGNIDAAKLGTLSSMASAYDATDYGATITGTGGTATWHAWKSGHTVTVYGYIRRTTTTTNISVTIPSAISAAGQYAVLTVASASSPYTTVGTMWIDGTTTAHIYLPSSQANFYVYGTYTTAS